VPRRMSRRAPRATSSETLSAREDETREAGARRKEAQRQEADRREAEQKREPTGKTSGEDKVQRGEARADGEDVRRGQGATARSRQARSQEEAGRR
jgi:hypothetical protein